MCMCVCMYVCVCTCVYVFEYVHVCTYVFVGNCNTARVPLVCMQAVFTRVFKLRTSSSAPGDGWV